MSLKSDLYDVFTADGMTNDDFADGIGDAIKSFVSSCSLTPSSPVAGADTSPAGTFSGSATVSWQITGSKIASKIKSVMQDMNDQKKGDDDLAQAICDGIEDDAVQWTASLSGTTTTTTTPPVQTPSSDQAVVNSVFVIAPVLSGLKSCFTTMKNMINEGDDGDDYFATQMASLVESYYKSSVNTGQGQTHLSACVFTVTVS